MPSHAHDLTNSPAPRSGSDLSRRRMLAGAGGLLALAGLAACSAPEAEQQRASATEADEAPRTAEEALARLREGNARYVQGTAKHPRENAEARAAVAEHQQPWALIHGCVDSRVSPELLFDQGIDDLFVTRTAGEVLDDTLMGSMEFAVGSPYEVPVIVILGHTACGAVTGTVKALAENPKDPQAPGEIADFIDEIAPVAREVKPEGDEAAHIDQVVRANAAAVAEKLVERSAIIRRAVQAGRTKVVAAVYDLNTGEVQWDVAG